MQNLLMKKSLKMAALLGVLTLASVAHAIGVPGQGTWETTLQARDLNKDGIADAFYDVDLNITWLRAASIQKMDWSTAKAWAEQDRFGLSGWRLPTPPVTTADGSCDWAMGGTSCGYNPDSSVATGSEMAHLFFQSLGNKSYVEPGTSSYPQAGWGLTNTAGFQNLEPAMYWSGTKYALNPYSAWLFDQGQGLQAMGDKDFGEYALAVRSGDVAAAVPELQTWALTLIGLAGLLLVRRRPH